MLRRVYLKGDIILIVEKIRSGVQCQIGNETNWEVRKRPVVSGTERFKQKYFTKCFIVRNICPLSLKA